ncbi:MAG: hypothetical protein OIF58_03985, partial [Cohaesibacter sp.]|nr:hypothetical protein [Cohaesibacter sp.]
MDDLFVVVCFCGLVVWVVFLVSPQGFPACRASFLISEFWAHDCHYRHDARSTGAKKNAGSLGVGGLAGSFGPAGNFDMHVPSSCPYPSVSPMTGP